MALNRGTARENAKFVKPGGKPTVVTRYDGIVSAPKQLKRFTGGAKSTKSKTTGSKGRRDRRRVRQGRMP